MATKKEEIKSGCLSRAADNEPVFVFRATDVSAPEFIDAWIKKHIKRLGEGHPKIKEARSTVEAMRSWPHRKLPD